MTIVMQKHRRRDSGDDELSDTTSELASAIHSSSFASPQPQHERRPDSSLVAQAGGGEDGRGDNINANNGTNNGKLADKSSSFVSPPQAKTTNEEEVAKQRGKMIVLVAICAIIVAIAVVAFVAAKTSNDPNRDDKTNAKAKVDQVIQDVSSNAALRNANSPQSRARHWMITVDQLTEDISREGRDRINQRYSLATFFFATGGGDSKWNRTVLPDQPPFDFINPATSECEWYGIVCAVTTDQPDDENTLARSRRYHHRRQYRFLQDEATTPTPTSTPVNSIKSTVFGLIFPRRNLTGELPPELRTMSYLRRIDLSSNQLKGTIANDVVANMGDLFWLDLSDNQLTGSIPKSLWRLPKLSHLFLYRNRLSGKIERHELAESATESSSTTSTSLTTTNTVDDAGASLIKPLSQVYLYENQLTGRMPSWFHELNGLDHWLAYKNQLSGPLPERQPEKLSFFDVSFNKLTGTIPSSLWATYPPPPLETLYLEHNQLTGTIPNSTQAQPRLMFVSLDSNRLAGSIPEGFPIAWTNLVKLRLQNNTISGTIPDSLWRHSNSPQKLTDLNLSYNNLSGTLPNSTQFRSLQEVRLQMNPNLTGTIPTNFAHSWQDLTVLEIQETSLRGQLGPVVQRQSECPNTWPRYSEVITSFRFSANCYQVFVTDPDPPVRCGCCTNCLEQKGE